MVGPKTSFKKEVCTTCKEHLCRQRTRIMSSSPDGGKDLRMFPKNPITYECPYARHGAGLCMLVDFWKAISSYASILYSQRIVLRNLLVELTVPCASSRP